MTPILQFTYGPGTAVQHLGKETAARDLGVSPPIVGKALQMGLLNDLSYKTVADAAALRVISGLRDGTGARVPVLRLGVFTDDISKDPPGETRRGFGYDVTLSPADLEASILRYWRTQYVQEVVDLGALVVVAASFIVAFAQVDGATPAGERWEFQGHLVAHTTNPLDASSLVEDAPRSPWMSDARGLIGCRLLGGGGGSITLA